MIDVSNLILKKVKEAVVLHYADCYFTSTLPESVTKDRVVAMTELDNYTYRKSLDDRNVEHHSVVQLQFDVFSNNAEGKRSEAKDIMSIVDDTMISNRFTRTMCQPVPNADRSYYRITARYEAVVAEDLSNGTDAINQVYRR